MLPHAPQGSRTLLFSCPRWIQTFCISALFMHECCALLPSSTTLLCCVSAPPPPPFPYRRMVLARFPTLAGLVHSPPMLHPGFSLASSASCEAFTEQQTSFLEPGHNSTQARSSVGKVNHSCLLLFSTTGLRCCSVHLAWSSFRRHITTAFDSLK